MRNRNYKGKKCKVCGVDVSIGSKLGFCAKHGINHVHVFSEASRNKLRELQLGSKNPMYGKPAWNRGIPASEKSKNILRQANLGKKWLPEELEKRNKTLPRGENHWAYKKDRTQLAKRQQRNDSTYYDWRLQVYKRDNYKCRIKNDDCRGRIQAHHILSWADYVELRYEVNNGITLCQAHHPLKRAEEKRLAPIFKALVSASIG